MGGASWVIWGPGTSRYGPPRLIKTAAVLGVQHVQGAECPDHDQGRESDAPQHLGAAAGTKLPLMLQSQLRVLNMLRNLRLQSVCRANCAGTLDGSIHDVSS